MKSILEISGSGDKIWSNEQGEFHREDGPALEWVNGNKAYYYHDQKIECKTDEEFKRLIKLKAFW
jgi:hypothetical protein